MIVVAGRVEIDSEKRTEAIEAALALTRDTRLEPGCISYTFSADLSDPSVFLVFEEWADQAALDTHFQTPHMGTFQKAMGGLGVRKVEVQKYTVSGVGPVR